MDVLVFDDPDRAELATFAARVQPVLARNRLMTNVLATWLDDAVRGQPARASCWFLIEDAGVSVAAAMNAAGFHVILTPVPDGDRERAVAALADALLARGEPVTGVRGRSVDAQAFAQAWAARGGGAARVVMNDWVYEITAVPGVPVVSGAGRLAAEDDAPTLVRYLIEFNREVYPERSEQTVSKDAESRAPRGVFLLWESRGEVVSMAALSGPAGGVARIGPIYTPPQFRGNGFGAAVTAMATRAGFERGAQSCMLYADQANPTSNGVYSRLGFQVVDANVMMSFGAA